MYISSVQKRVIYVEAFIVRIIKGGPPTQKRAIGDLKAAIVIVFVSAILGNTAISPTPPLCFAKRSSRGKANPNNLAAYYGFDEIEIIKLDWGIKALRIADFNGDGRNDIAVVNNRKAKIELLLQKESIGPGETAIAVDPNDIDVNTIIPPTRI